YSKSGVGHLGNDIESQLWGIPEFSLDGHDLVVSNRAWIVNHLIPCSGRFHSSENLLPQLFVQNIAFVIWKRARRRPLKPVDCVRRRRICALSTQVPGIHITIIERVFGG